MATRSHVDVNERRLRPIYDCLDNGSNKEALREADKVLKKQKDFQCAKVLKCLALMRLGRSDDSQEFLKAVHDQQPCDEATLQAMAICYRECDRLDLLADAYCNASKKRPDSEEIMTALFMAYVRLGDYKRQQLTAMSLFKSKPKTPYYFWAIMSIVMQAHCDPKLSKTMYLPLAERMVVKHIKDGKVDSEAEVALYLIILEELGKYDEALCVLGGELGGKLVTELDMHIAKKLEYLTKMARWPELNVIYRKQLKKDNDSWFCYEGYFKSLFHLVDTGWTPANSELEYSLDEGECQADYTIEAAIEFINQAIADNQSSERPKRGPYLARLELYKQLKQKENTLYQSIGEVGIMLESYFDMFCRKQCCFRDLSQYVCLLDGTGKKQFLQCIGEKAKYGEWSTLPEFENMHHVQQHMTVLQLTRYCGLHTDLSHADKHLLVQHLYDAFEQAYKIRIAHVATDMQLIDNYAIIAVHLLMDIYCDTGDMTVVWRGIEILENVFRKAPTDFQVKLLLIKLYSELGAFGACADMYDRLEVKHLQQDTLGFMVCNDMTRYGHFGASCTFYDTTLRFFNHNIKEMLEYIISAYKYGSFTKVYEFVKFKEHLENSLNYGLAMVSRLLLDLTMDCDSHEKAEEDISAMHSIRGLYDADWEKMNDNRDLDIMVSYSDEYQKSSHKIAEASFKEEKAWLKVQSLSVRCLASAVMMSSDVPIPLNGCLGEDKDFTNEDVFESVTDNLESHLQICQTEFRQLMQFPINGPRHTKLKAFLDKKHGQVLINALRATLHIKKCQNNGIESEKLGEKFSHGTVDILKERVAKAREGLAENKDCYPEVLADIVLVTETISYLAIICGVCHKMLKPWKSNLQRKKKKKGHQETKLPSVFSSFSEIFKSLVQIAKEVSQLAQDIIPKFLHEEFQDIHIEDHLTEKENIIHEIHTKATDSYKQSANDICEILKRKIKYLQSLRL